MENREFSGRSAAEAAIKACETLGVTRSELKYQVLSDEGQGLERKVVIAVSAPAAKAAERPAEKRTPSSKAPASEEKSESRAAAPREAREGREGRSRGGRRGGRSGEGRSEGGREEGSRRGEGRRGGGRRSSPRSQGPAQEEVSGEASNNQLDSLLSYAQVEAVAERPAVTPQTERGKQALEILQNLLQLLGFDLQVHLVEEEGTEIELDITGKDTQWILGKRGEVMLALQFVANRMMGCSEEESGARVLLDVEGYRRKRQAALEDLAQKLAHKAVALRKVVRLSRMSARDRRIFHLALGQVTGIVTRSEGEGSFRNLLIIPAQFV